VPIVTAVIFKQSEVSQWSMIYLTYCGYNVLCCVWSWSHSLDNRPTGDMVMHVADWHHYPLFSPAPWLPSQVIVGYMCNMYINGLFCVFILFAMFEMNFYMLLCCCMTLLVL